MAIGILIAIASIIGIVYGIIKKNKPYWLRVRRSRRWLFSAAPMLTVTENFWSVELS